MIITPELNNWLEWLSKRIPDLKYQHNKDWVALAMSEYAESFNKSASGNNTDMYDCDYCKNFPCSLQTWSNTANKKLKLNECGDFKPLPCEK